MPFKFRRSFPNPGNAIALESPLQPFFPFNVFLIVLVLNLKESTQLDYCLEPEA